MIIKRTLVSCLMASASTVSCAALADFLDDSKGNLEIRNFYFSRDFRDDTATQSKREEWAQGFILKLQSGYTEGTVGFGVDAIAMLGLKLDSSPDRSGSGLLPRDSQRRAADEYSSVAPTAKFRAGESELRVGALTPYLPLVVSNFSRLMPQMFKGAMLVSKDIDDLTFTLGRIQQLKGRDSSDFEDLSVTGMFGAYSAARSDRLDYIGFDYKLTPELGVSYHASRLEDIYRRDFVGIQYRVPVGSGQAFTELRYFDGSESGRAAAGLVDNRTLSTNFGYKIGGHTFSGGYQKVTGDTAFIFLNTTDTYLFSEMLVSTFGLQNERSWHTRYDYDFAALGVPGLVFSLRYVKGDQVDPENISGAKGAALRANGEHGREWERSADIGCTFQSGMLKNLSLRWRNATNRSTFTEGVDENRLIASYQLSF